MPLLYKGQPVKKIQVVAGGKKKLVATARQYKNKLEGDYNVISDDRIEVKEFWIGKDGRKTLKSTGTFNFDDILVEYTYKPPKT